MQTEQSEPAQKAAVQKGTEKQESPWSWLLSIVITVTVALLFCNFVARPSRVLGESMENTFHDGDMVILWELQYHPQRGDVVVVNDQNSLHENLIKRVIAVGGDHVIVRNGTVTCNGKKLKEPYVKEAVWSGQNTEVILSPGQVFLMGDNRNHSADSRMIGPVDASTIIGKVSFRFYPFNRIQSF